MRLCAARACRHPCVLGLLRTVRRVPHSGGKDEKRLGIM
nr:MAG TPA: hypothetical protein [Caudoviricetes sp.]